MPELGYVDGQLWRRLGARGVWTLSSIAMAAFVVLLVWLFT